MADERTRPTEDTEDARDKLIKQQAEALAHLRDDVARLARERDRLKRHNERLKRQLDAARRAGFRQAAPFAKDRPQGRGRPRGRHPGRRYGCRARRAIPAHVDVTYEAPLPETCPGCGGAVQLARVAPQYQEDLPVVRPIVRRFDVPVGCCVACGRRVQGRHPLQTSDALGAANVHLGPGAVTFLVLLHKHVGVPLDKIATLLRERFGLTVTPGGALVHESGVRLRGGRPDWMDEVESPSHVQDKVPRPELGRL